MKTQVIHHKLKDFVENPDDYKYELFVGLKYKIQLDPGRVDWLFDLCVKELRKPKGPVILVLEESISDLYFRKMLNEHPLMPWWDEWISLILCWKHRNQTENPLKFMPKDVLKIILSFMKRNIKIDKLQKWRKFDLCVVEHVNNLTRDKMPEKIGTLIMATTKFYEIEYVRSISENVIEIVDDLAHYSHIDIDEQKKRTHYLQTKRLL